MKHLIESWRTARRASIPGAPPVVIESPYAGDVETHRLYLQRLIREVALAGGTPYASHQMLPGALNDDDPAERQLGMHLGRTMVYALPSPIIVFGLDYGWSPGMKSMRDWLDERGMRWESVTIGKNQ